MTTNNLPIDGQSIPQPPLPAVAPPKEKRIYSDRERWLLLIAFGAAILYNRFIFNPLYRYQNHFPLFSGLFWLVFLAVFCGFYREKLAANRPLWLAGGLTAALGLWNVFFDYRSSYGLVTYLVLPMVIMALMQCAAGDLSWKKPGKIARAWLAGWFVKPFTGIPAFFECSGGLLAGAKRERMGKIGLGLLLTCPLLLIILPLLSSADRVFGFFLGELLTDFDLPVAFLHLLVTLFAAVLLYSLLWNAGYGAKKAEATGKALQIDAIVSGIVLTATVLVYLLFCGIQFTYLFAGAGLPMDVTYSEYAREGFAQIIVICGLNLLLFGVFLHYSAKHRGITALLAALLGVTGIMLVSGFVRLKLYIDAYGLTWLRLLSAWFLLYLAAVLILCAVRMARGSLPLITVCAFLLLGWYVLLGYANPDAMIVRYNIRASNSAVTWLEENRYYAYRLSDDGIKALVDEGLDSPLMAEIVENRLKQESGYSISSQTARRDWERLEAEATPRE